ncbi:actin-like ATPase domain-containing protein [Clavulina sp. PMI_390]|nr:actin-like ATPase domain-containing protein [Clavulina sp. PMI_390]
MLHLWAPPQAPSIPVYETDYETRHLAEKTPIVIDNGATDFRYGWATSRFPYTGLNAMAKYRERRTNTPVLLFGDPAEADAASKLAMKTTWEGDILANPEALEAGFDLAFIHLGINSESVDHPIIMTERLATPITSRALTSELLFEAYGSPSVAYAIDGPLSFAYNRPDLSSDARDGLVISFNTASTSIIPILNGKGILSHSKRLPWGGFQAAEYLNKLLALKYPTFNTKLTNQHANWMLRNFCSCSPEYPATLKSLASPAGLSAADIVIQFPFASTVREAKSEEQLAQLAEKRKEAGRRLQEQAAKNRAEKLARNEEDLKHLQFLKAWKEKESKAEFTARLRSDGISSEAILDEEIKRIEAALKRTRKKDETIEDEPMEEPTFPLADVPDSELNEEQIKEKRKQKLAKAGYEARVRARKEKEREREAKAAAEQQEQEEREADPAAWTTRVRQEHSIVMDRIRERKKRRAALTDRKSAAAQNRMKSIATLADDQPAPKKKKKGNHEDLFGKDDSDWMVYRKVVSASENLDVPSDDEEDDLAALANLESKLFTYDNTFSYADTYEGISSRQSALMTAFRPRYPEGDAEGANRIHLNIERWRVPEVWFQPSIAGVDSAGLGELLESVLKTFSADERQRVVKDVFLTGGPALMPGFAERLTLTLRPILPPDTPLNVSRAGDPRLDAWHGMAAVARSDELPRISVTKAEYEEWGGERIKRWWGGNWNLSF